MQLLHPQTFSCTEVTSEEIITTSNFSKPLQIPNENIFSFCLTFCYITGRLAKNQVKKRSQKTAALDTDWSTVAIPKYSWILILQVFLSGGCNQWHFVPGQSCRLSCPTYYQHMRFSSVKCFWEKTERLVQIS